MPIFGKTNYIRFLLFFRSVIGFGGIAFSFLSVELLPIGDSTVLCMLSPFIAAVLGVIILSEPWRKPEIIGTLF